jgi:hypothetical protein
MTRVRSFIVAALAAGVLAPGAATHPSAEGQPFRLVVVDRLSRSQLHELAARGAVGLLVPGVGPTTSRRQALAALVRGQELDAHLGGLAHGRRLLAISTGSGLLDGPSIVVALPPAGPPVRNDRRYPVAVIGGDFHGLLRSPTTRIDGLVSIVDIAPTALGRLRGSLRSVADDEPVATLTRLDRQIRANDRLKLPTLIIIAGALILLRAVRPRAAIPAILAALLTSIAIGALEVTSEPAIVATIVTGTIGGGLALMRIARTDTRMLVAITVVLAIHVLLLVMHPDWVAVSPLGPTQNSRFWGIGNQLETLLLGPLIAGSLLAGRRYGMAGFATFALLALVLVTDNRLGSDGGGAIVFGIALAFTGARALRLGLRGFTTLLLIAASVVLADVSYNLHGAGPDHLRSAFTHGLHGVLAVFVNRVPLAYLPALRQWPVVLPLACGFLTTLVVALRTSERSARDLLAAAALAIGASLLVNDSAAYELAAGAAVIVALGQFQPTALPLHARASLRLSVARQPLPNDVGGD